MQVTIIRDNRKKKCTADELQNGDIIIDGNLSADEPYYLRPDLTDLTLRDGNFKNVLLDLPAFLPGIDGIIKIFPAATHTAGWTIEGGLHHCYGLRSVEDEAFKKQQVDAEFDAAYRGLAETFEKMDKIVEKDAVKLAKMQDLFATLESKDPAGVGRLLAKTNAGRAGK